MYRIIIGPTTGLFSRRLQKELVIYDGLNEYYTKESSKLFEGFAERAAINSHNGIRNYHFTTWTMIYT